MKIVIEVELGETVKSWDDVVNALVVTGDSLSDASEPIGVEYAGVVFATGSEGSIGTFAVTSDALGCFTNLLA